MKRSIFSSSRAALACAFAALSLVSCSEHHDQISNVPDDDHKHSHLAGADLYDNFAELNAAEPNSYTITTRDIENGNLVDSRTIIFTPHGGGIEPGSTEIADAIANAPTGADYDFYTFTGVKSSNNGTLHITSTNFDEPTCVNMVSVTNRTVAIHGCSGDAALVYVGGRDSALKADIAEALEDAGFTVSLNPPGYLGGTSTSNICNRNTVGQGVQLEISRGLRQQMMTTLNTVSGRATTKTTTFYSFVNAVRAALAQ